jgi:hypothetical protein
MVFIEMSFRDVTRELIALIELEKPAEVAALIPNRRSTSSLAAHLRTLLSDPRIVEHNDQSQTSKKRECRETIRSPHTDRPPHRRHPKLIQRCA